MEIKRIGVLTCGGDAPGMNAAIRSIVRYANYLNIEVIGIFKGFWGLINEELKKMSSRNVSGIINLGGTILKTARCPEFMTEEGRRRSYEVIKKHGIDGLIIIGGDGSCRGAHQFYLEYKFPCICIAASIDNDINGITATIGSDTAINTALEAIDNIRDTASSMERIFVVEVMGRESGFIALQVALAGGCEEVIIPEREFDLEKICHDIVNGNLRGKVSWIIICAEGAARAEDIAQKIIERTSLEVRTVVLGHIQRGGRPTAFSRILATRLGKEAVDLLLKGITDKIIGLVGGEIKAVDLEFAIQKKKIQTEEIYNLVRILT